MDLAGEPQVPCIFQVDGEGIGLERDSLCTIDWNVDISCTMALLHRT